MPRYVMNLDACDEAYGPRSIKVKYDGNTQSHVIYKVLYGRWGTELTVAVACVPDDSPRFIHDMIEDLRQDALIARVEYEDRPVRDSFWLVQDDDRTRDILDQIEYHMDEHRRERDRGAIVRRIYPTFDSPVCALDQ